MNGQGFLGLDVLLFMMTCGAAAVHVFYLPAWYRASAGLGLMRLLRLTGWTILATRFGWVLAHTGDILTTLPSTIALMFLAAGEIAAIFNRGKAG